jgi:hypothetical protein
VGKLATYFHALNSGVHDPSALARVDLERIRLAAEEQTNFLCKATGPAFLRPGLEYLTSTHSNLFTRLKEFIFGVTDAALLELLGTNLRVRISDTLITRPAVTSTVTSGDFSSGAGWTLTATSGATSAVSGGLLQLTAGARGSLASATQAVTTSSVGTEHALRIVIARGPVTFRLGSSSGADDYINETQLQTGTHSLSFTPTSSPYYIEFKSALQVVKQVDSIQVESAGIMLIPTPWAEADLGKVRFAQSADVVFCAAIGYQQQRIERRGSRSWSVVNYVSDDGPFTVDRTRAVKLKSSVTEGNGTLTADGPFFNASHVGALFKLTHEGFNETVALGAAGQFSDPFRVTGVAVSGDYNDRDWSYTITGTWVGTLRWYRSFDGKDSGFKQFRKNATPGGPIPITGNVSDSNGDSDNNAIIWYKLGFEEGSYTSGNATVSINYDGGGGAGLCRVTSYTSPTVVNIEVLTPFKAVAFTDNWQEGEWSGNQIWPSSVAFSDGRLWWSGEDRLWGSVSDAFHSFDEDVEGDSGPISRSIATGGVNATQWLLSLQRLVIGTEGAVTTAKSSSLDEPLTPTSITLKDSATTGCASIESIKIDGRGLFIERAGKALMELVFDGAANDYVATQLSKLTTELFNSGVKAVGVQRRPDTRIWAVMNDGTCVCCVYEPDQEVLAFIPMETDGTFESVAVLPALEQDRVYFSVARSINGSTVRYVEKMALDTEVKPTTLCKVMDAFKVVTNGPASATVAGLTHLIGETVVVWADGAPIETAQGVRAEFVVNGSGVITLPSAATNIVVGLPYRGRYKSARLAYAAEGGTAMLQKKKVDSIGMILTDFARFGIKYGWAFDDPYRGLYPLPIKANGSTQSAVVLSDIHDEEAVPFGGEWDTDARVCIEVNSPYPATVLGLVMQITTNG